MFGLVYLDFNDDYFVEAIYLFILVVNLIKKFIF